MADGATIYQGLLDRGFGPVQAAALAGNLQQESDFNPAAVNPSSGAYGLGQWLGSRAVALRQYAQQTGRNAADPEAQLDFIVHEMNGPEAGNVKSFLAAPDVQSANAALKSYLRYGQNEGGNRLAYSMKFTKNAPSAPSNAPASADVQGQLDQIFGPTPSADKAVPLAEPANADVEGQLDQIFGVDTIPAVGTPAYAAYIKSLVQQGKPTPQPATPPPGIQTPQDVVPGWMRAFSANAVEGVPVLGAGARGLRNMLIGPGAEAQMEQVENQARTANPLAAGAGTVFGAVAPLAAAGTTEAGAQLLGMTGGLPQRMLMGGLSGATLAGADTLARGGNADEARTNALIGLGLGGAAPLAGKAVGSTWNALMGRTGDQIVADALRADANNPANVNSLLQAAGPGSTVADLGPNTRGLAAGLASLPGEPKSIVVNNLMQRAAGAGPRLQQDVAGTIGQGQPIGALVDQITAAQKSAADPLYAQFRTQSVQITPGLATILDTPIGREAYQRAVTLAANDGIQAPKTIAALKKAGGANAAVFDYAKQALDDMTSAAQRAGENNAARQSTLKANALIDEIDTQLGGAPGHGPYADARSAFAGPAKVKDAIETGQGLFSSKVSPEDLSNMIATMSPSEFDGLLAGAQAAVQKAIGGARTNAAGMKHLFASDYGKEKLALLVGQNQADQIEAALSREANFADTSAQAYRNSITAANAAQQKVLSPSASGFQNPMLPQSGTGLLMAALAKARNGLTASYRNAQNARAASILTSPQPDIAGLGRADNALIAPASVPLLMQGANSRPNPLTWAGPAIDASAIPSAIVHYGTSQLQ